MALRPVLGHLSAVCHAVSAKPGGLLHEQYPPMQGGSYVTDQMEPAS
jgi:hypothetical protein